MMKVLGTKPNGETMSEIESAYSYLEETIQGQLNRLNSSDAFRAEIEMLIGIVNETDNPKAKRIMKNIVKIYKQIMLDMDKAFLTAKHELDMRLIEEQQKKKC